MASRAVLYFIFALTFSPFSAASLCRPRSSNGSDSAVSPTRTSSVATTSSTTGIPSFIETSLTSTSTTPTTSTLTSTSTNSTSPLETSSTTTTTAPPDETTTTSTSTTESEGTTSTTSTTTTTEPPAPSCDPAADPLANGDFESGEMAPWYYDVDYNRLSGSVVTPGYPPSNYMWKTALLHNNDLVEIRQDFTTCVPPGSRYRCTYVWYFDKYYSVWDVDGYLVPYLRIWHGPDPIEVVGNRWPTDESQTGVWMDGAFEFDVAEDNQNTIWIDSASPQSEADGDNWFAIDEIHCTLL